MVETGYITFRTTQEINGSGVNICKETLWRLFYQSCGALSHPIPTQQMVLHSQKLSKSFQWIRWEHTKSWCRAILDSVRESCLLGLQQKKARGRPLDSYRVEHWHSANYTQISVYKVVFSSFALFLNLQWPEKLYNLLKFSSRKRTGS